MNLFFAHQAGVLPGVCLLYHLDLIGSSKDYVEISDGIIPIEKHFGLITGIIGITAVQYDHLSIVKISNLPTQETYPAKPSPHSSA